jgi:hypothetical protein
LHAAAGRRRRPAPHARRRMSVSSPCATISRMECAMTAFVEKFALEFATTLAVGAVTAFLVGSRRRPSRRDAHAGRPRVRTAVRRREMALACTAPGSGRPVDVGGTRCYPNTASATISSVGSIIGSRLDSVAKATLAGDQGDRRWFAFSGRILSWGTGSAVREPSCLRIRWQGVAGARFPSVMGKW